MKRLLAALRCFADVYQKQTAGFTVGEMHSVTPCIPPNSIHSAVLGLGGSTSWLLLLRVGRGEAGEKHTSKHRLKTYHL